MWVKRFINGIKYDGKGSNDIYLETTNDEHIKKKKSPCFIHSLKIILNDWKTWGLTIN